MNKLGLNNKNIKLEYKIFNNLYPLPLTSFNFLRNLGIGWNVIKDFLVGNRKYSFLSN